MKRGNNDAYSESDYSEMQRVQRDDYSESAFSQMNVVKRKNSDSESEYQESNYINEVKRKESSD